MLMNYLKIAIKVLLRRKFFAVVSLFGISVTLMVLMVVSSVLDQAVGPRPPASERSRILGIYEAAMSGPRGRSSSSPGYLLLDSFARELPGIERESFFSHEDPVTSWVDGRKIETQLKRTDAAFWRIFDFDFVEGGPFSDQDDRDGQFVAVINETTRRRFFGKRPALGQEIRADNQTFRVVGVVRDVSMLIELPFAEMWAPISTMKTTQYRHEWLGGFQAALLAGSRTDFDRAREEFRRRLTGAQLPDPKQFDTLTSSLETRIDRIATPFFGEVESRSALFRLVVVGAMLLFMLLPAVNLVNLNLSRILERASEIGVRKSFGASSRDLVAQFLVENLVLTLIGGALGLLLSLAALELLNVVGPLPYAEHRLHPRIFLYGLALAGAFALVSGIYPAWKAANLDPIEALRYE